MVSFNLCPKCHKRPGYCRHVRPTAALRREHEAKEAQKAKRKAERESRNAARESTRGWRNRARVIPPVRRRRLKPNTPEYIAREAAREYINQEERIARERQHRIERQQKAAELELLRSINKGIRELGQYINNKGARARARLHGERWRAKHADYIVNYRSRPEQKAWQRTYNKVYRMVPEVKERTSLRNSLLWSDPLYQEALREYRQLPEVRAARKAARAAYMTTLSAEEIAERKHRKKLQRHAWEKSPRGQEMRAGQRQRAKERNTAKQSVADVAVKRLRRFRWRGALQ